MKKLTPFLFSLLLILISQTETRACTCIEYNTPVCAMLSRADAVFSGRVERITPFVENKGGIAMGNIGSISSAGDSGLVWLHVKVERKFKGIAEDTVKVITDTNTSCSMGVKKGERWLFYTSRDQKDGSLSAGACSGTTRIDRSDAAHLEQLGGIAADKNIESIIGFVDKDQYGFDGLKDVLVNIEGANFRSSTATNRLGLFSVRVPQPGKYKVSVTVPFAGAVYLIPYSLASSFSEMLKPTETQSTFMYEAEVLPKQCQYAEMVFNPVDLKATAEISGKFTDYDRNELPRANIKLCRLKETEKETLDSCGSVWHQKPDGSFSFGGLREGRFVLAVSARSHLSMYDRFQRSYYPGVSNFSEAGIINLEQGQKIGDLNFKLPPLVPTREITGRLFWNEKTPIAFSPDASYDETPHILLYYLEKENENQGSESYKFKNDGTEATESVETININSDGTFSALAFDEKEYIINTYLTDKKGKERCGFAKIKVDRALAPLKIILNQNGNCQVDDYLKALKKK